MSTHNLCFGTKIKKKVYPCQPQFCYIKVGFKGVYIARTRFPDVIYGFGFLYLIVLFAGPSSLVVSLLYIRSILEKKACGTIISTISLGCHSAAKN